MKKIVSVLTLAALVLPMIASALVGVPTTCKLKRNLSDISQKIDGTNACTSSASVNIEIYGMCCLVNTIYGIADWIFYVLMAFVGVMIVIGAFFIITAGGEPNKVNQGRNYILYAVIGMLVAFFARAIPAIVKLAIGM